MKPMLATLVSEAFDSTDWIFEIKWDGFRAIAQKEDQVEIWSRNDKSFNDRFPTIVQELEKIPGTFVLDGEITLLDDEGRSHFQNLQNYQKEKVGTPYYFLFDILSYNGKDLTCLPLLDRKKILQQLLKKSKLKYLQFSAHLETQGKEFFQKAKDQGLEGIVAKKKDSTYQFRRSKDWLKIKAYRRQEVVIGGFTAPQGERDQFGSLLVGVYEKGKLKFAGHVGGGFNQKLLKEVYSQLKKLVRKSCPFDNEPHPNRQVTWVTPKLVCEVSFAEWTQDNHLRQPIFKGLRSDKAAKEVRREYESKTNPSR